MCDQKFGPNRMFRKNLQNTITENIIIKNTADTIGIYSI